MGCRAKYQSKNHPQNADKKEEVAGQNIREKFKLKTPTKKNGLQVKIQAL